MAYQILIVDDSPLIRNSIRSVIERQTDWAVCGEAENGEIAVQKVRELNPTLVILDFQMPMMNGLEAADQISRISPKLPMLMFTMHLSEQLETAAKAVGIRCLVSKSAGLLDDLVCSITNLLQELPATQATNGESPGEIASQASTPSLCAQTCPGSPSLACIMKCEERNRLAALYEQTTTKCSRAIAELRRKMGTSTKEEYQRVEHAANEARVKSEQARFALEQHIATHRMLDFALLNIKNCRARVALRENGLVLAIFDDSFAQSAGHQKRMQIKSRSWRDFISVYSSPGHTFSSYLPELKEWGMLTNGV